MHRADEVRRGMGGRGGFALILLLLSAGAFGFRNGLAKDYRVDKIEVEACVRPDGSVRLVEKRVYAFRGDFSWADYLLPLRGIARVESLAVWEGKTAFARNRSGAPGTFEVDSTKDLLSVKWHFRARNQTRVFHLAFVLPSLVTAHQDVAELRYNFIGAGDRKEVGEAEVRLAWTRVPAESSVAVWVHGKKPVAVTFGRDGSLTFRARRLAPREFLEARVLFPLTSVPEIAGPRDGLTSERIRGEEAARAAREAAEEVARAERDEARRRRLHHAAWFLSFLTLAGFALAAHLWWNFGKPHAVRGVPKYQAEPPSEREPALVAYLLRGEELGPEALLATLFDLAYRGALQFERLEANQAKEKDWTFQLRKAEVAPSLRPWEAELIHFLFDELSENGQTLRGDELRRKRGRLRRWYFTWRKALISAAESEGIFEPLSRVARNKALGVAATLMLTGLAFMFVAGWPGAISFFPGLVLLVFAFAMVRRNPAAQEEMLRWKAYSRYLRRFAASGEPAMVPGTQDRAWIYALVLGLGPKQVRSLTERLFGPSGVSWLGVPPGSRNSVAWMVSVLGSTVAVGAGPAGGGAAGGAVGRAG